MTKDYNGNEIKPGDRVYYQTYNCTLTVQSVYPGRVSGVNPRFGQLDAFSRDCELVSRQYVNG